MKNSENYSIIIQTNDAIQYGLREAILYSAASAHYKSVRKKKNNDDWALWSKTIVDKFFPFWHTEELKEVMESVMNKDLIFFRKDNKGRWIFKIPSDEDFQMKEIYSPFIDSRPKKKTLNTENKKEERIKEKIKKETKQREKLEGFYAVRTYCFFDPGSSLYKIGSSRNPKTRFKHFRIGNPEIKKVFALEENAESEIHKKYKDKRVRGEWFSFNAKDVAEIKNAYTPIAL